MSTFLGSVSSPESMLDIKLSMMGLEKCIFELMTVTIPQLEMRFRNEISSLRQEFEGKLDLVRSGVSIQPVLDRLKDDIFSWLKPDSLNNIKLAPEARSVNMKKLERWLSKDVLERQDGVEFISGLRIPTTVQSISEKCFSDCKSLSEVTFCAGSQLKEIDEEAFYKTSLKSIKVPRRTVCARNVGVKVWKRLFY